MSLTHKFSRDNEASAHMRREKVDQMQTAMYEERGESSRRGEVADLNARAGPSRRLLDVPPSWLIDQHSACVGTCSHTGYGHHLPYSGHKYGRQRTYEMQEATSAPACTSLVTWQADTCQGRHTTHYHHHYYHYETATCQGRHRAPIRNSHACNATDFCCAVNTPHDFSSHGGPPINYPVNIIASAKPAPVPTRHSKRFTKHEQAGKAADQALSLLGYAAETAPLSVHAAEEALSLLGYAAESAPQSVHAAEDALSLLGYAAGAAALTSHAAEEAPPLTVFKAGPPPPLKHCSRHLPPFPSSHASPYVLCQHCSRLLLLPPSTVLFPPPGTLLLERFLFVKLKCSYCLNISKFSTRHLHRASSPSLAEGICSPVPPPTQRPVELPSMPSCIPSNGVMQEASALNHNETEEPLNGIFKSSSESNSLKSKLLISGNVEHNLKHETGAPLNGVCKHISNQNHIESSEPLNGLCGDSAQSKIVETVALCNGICVHTQEIVIKTGESRICEDLAQSEHVLTGARINGKCAHTQETVIESAEPLSGLCGDLTQPKHLETGMLVNGNCGQTAKDKDNEMELNGVCEDTSDHKEIEIGVKGNAAMHDSHSDREQEITAFSSVQDWVDSLSVEIGYESDNQLQGPLNCPNDFVDGLEKFPSSRHRSPLHQHFGYGSPSELFEKVLFSEDDEIKARTETNSTASSSFSSTNPCQPTETKSPSIHVHAASLQSWSLNPDSSSGVIGSIEQDAQRSFTGLLRKSLKRGSLLSANTKTRVVVNGHALSSAAVKQAEERAGKLRPGSYWYDCKAGFWGVEGGPCLGILPPYIEELNYPMTKQCSNGDTQVYVNGRELHAKDLMVLSQRGLSQKAGRAYALGFDGVLVDETTGLELKHLGKLAPTVERKGKGFGMFTADVLQSKTPAVHQIKLANSSH